MPFRKQGISPENFYGGKNPDQDKIERAVKQDSHAPQPKFMTRLLGPSRTWKIFKKQQDCIDCCLLRRNGLMPFAFEDINGRRMFLTAHPKVFWALNSHRFFNNCSSYEIIREYSACKLYLDIEFEYAYNKDKNGEKMLDTLLSIINFNLKEFFNVICGKLEILDLDSSSETKFSHHVIYQITNGAFQHNYAVGDFIKNICNELKEAFQNKLSEEKTKLEEVAKKYSLTECDILDLFVIDRKYQRKLLIDEGVYTKNRHFRLLGSTKRGKNVSLSVSKRNEYKPEGECGPLDYFLDSLVTYFSGNVERVLEFGNQKTFKPPNDGKRLTWCSGTPQPEPNVFPQIDAYIAKLISPRGRIRKKVFFSNSSTIVYDIQGFRYCDNIKTEHKSNNIRYVVDLGSLGFYQKCHDPDCFSYRSDMKRLPEEICFLFEDESLFRSGLSEEEFVKFIEQIETDCKFENSITDEELDKVADYAEAMLDLNW